jgi:hypothetical protein
LFSSNGKLPLFTALYDNNMLHIKRVDILSNIGQTSPQDTPHTACYQSCYRNPTCRKCTMVPSSVVYGTDPRSPKRRHNGTGPKGRRAAPAVRNVAAPVDAAARRAAFTANVNNSPLFKLSGGSYIVSFISANV